jgi:predicted CopG family antitoxin
MPTRSLTITEEAYERLKARKEEKDSFSDVIMKMTNKGRLMDFAGILTEKEANELEKNIKELRKHSGNRMEHIRKELNE